ncbi:MAG TPA: hypothetical protein VK801_07215 [Caulobacteraceae bacterium]|nr:hypothetical protein [Caulobacteraceae bacterium]
MPVAIPLAIVGAAGLGAGASLIGSGEAASAAKSAASQSNALESQIYSQNSANAQPYIQAGDAANTALQGFLGIGADPAASQKALSNYLNSTGYQFDLNQGLNAVETSKAAQGLLGSGSTLQALDSFATGKANQYGQQYEQNLQNVAGTGQAAASALAGQGQSYANSVSTNNTNAANATGNAFVSGANTFNGLLGNAMNAFSFAKGGSSFGGGSGGSYASGIGNMIGG